MATDETDFDLAKALIDLSLGTKEPAVAHDGTTSNAAESALRGTLKGQVDIPDVLSAHDTFSTPIKSIIPQFARDEQVVEDTKDTIKSFKTSNSLVILQPLCDSHKFSRNVRPRELDSIVERPERTRAAVLGIFLARAWLETSCLDEPAFDIRQTQREGWLGDAAVESVHGFEYPQQLLKLCQNAEATLQAQRLEVPEHYPWGDLYLGPQSLQAIQGCLGALYDGIDAIFLKHYSAVHICIRPPGHHAAEISPCGFCWINNVHVALAYARAKYKVRRAVILDFDLHHGDGSQSIAWTINEREPNTIAYYSLHDIYSYPCEAGNVEKIREASVSISAHGHHIHNVHLRPYKTQAEFDELYRNSYKSILDKAEQYLSEGVASDEEAIICISAGYDASEHEINTMQRHKVSVPTSFYERFTSDAVKLAQAYTKGRIFSVMEGGYGDRAITSAACSHMLGLFRQPVSPNANACYATDNLKVIEKVFPPKNRPLRRPTRFELEERPWLQPMLKLYEDNYQDAKGVKPDSLLDNLGKMTLRERKSGPSTPLSVSQVKPVRRTPRNTPLKAKASKADVIPPLPNLEMIKDTAQIALAAQTPLPVTPQHDAFSSIKTIEPVLKPEDLPKSDLDHYSGTLRTSDSFQLDPS